MTGPGDPDPAAATAVSMALPSDWYIVVPAPPGGGRGEPDADAGLGEVLAGLWARAASADVVFSACGALGGAGRPTAAGGVVVAVRAALEAGSLHGAASRLETADPGCRPQQEVCRLPMAGPAARLAWTPAAGPDHRRVACAEYYVPFPAEERVAVVGCAAVGTEEPESMFAYLDGLAGTLCFVEAISPAAGTAR